MRETHGEDNLSKGDSIPRGNSKQQIGVVSVVRGLASRFKLETTSSTFYCKSTRGTLQGIVCD